MQRVGEVKKVLILCNADPTRGEIIRVVRGSGYRTLRVSLTVKALESLQNSGVADLVILGQHENASDLKEWLENNCSGVPIIVIVGCKCESEKIAHTDYEINESELNQLPALIKQLIGPPSPLSYATLQDNSPTTSEDVVTKKEAVIRNQAKIRKRYSPHPYNIKHKW